MLASGDRDGRLYFEAGGEHMNAGVEVIFHNPYLKIRRNNKDEAAKLAGPDWNVLNLLMKALSLPRIGLYDQELIKRDLIAMAKEARERGESLADIIGEDPKYFCDSLAESTGAATVGEKLLYWLELCVSNLWFWAIVLFLEYTQENGIMEIPVVFGSVYMALLFCISGIQIFVSSKYVFGRRMQRLVPAAAGFLGAALCCLPLYIFNDQQDLVWEIHAGIVLGVQLLLFLLTKLVFYIHMYHEAVKDGG